jgi:RNA polymerase sigma-70 factor (ECF subfamily)
VCADDQSEDDAIDALFAADGHTRDMPRQWGNPDGTLEQKDFFRVLEVCLEKLPAQTARIFMMREWLELDTDEICKELAITSANAWVILYRARVRLRECLDLNWFGNCRDLQDAAIWNGIKPTCREVHRLVSEGMDRELSWSSAPA